ncbi:ash family protein [Salmonella enterica]
MMLTSLNLSKLDAGKSKNRLPVSLNRIYSIVVVAKSTTGRGNPYYSMATQTPKASFFVSYQRIPVKQTVSMVALVGQPSGWPVSIEAGISTPASVTAPYERGNSGGDSINSMEAALWLLPSPCHTRNISGLSLPFAATAQRSPQKFTISPQIVNMKPAASLRGKMSASSQVACQLRGHIMNNLLIMPVPVSADLFQLADICTAFAAELVESTNAAESLALCGRLSHALTALRLLCDEDLPSHLIEHLTVGDLPAPCVPDCWADSYLLVGYALGLTQALLSCTLPRAATMELTGLLHDLIMLMAEYLKQPYLMQEVAK